MNVASLFAGVGGFDLGFERAGMHTTWQVEQDAYCRATVQDAESNGGPGQFKRNSLPLNAAVLLPTPTSSNRDSAGGSGSRAKQKREGTYISGRLNPTWVEWLMGFPPEWTAFAALGNALVPQIAEWIGTRIMTWEAEQ